VARKMFDPFSVLFNMRAEDLKIALFLIAKCNWKEGEWFDGIERIKVPAGCMITSLNHLVSSIPRINLQAIRTSLKNLEKIGFLTRHSTRRYTTIKLLNYSYYQDPGNYELTHKLTQDQHKANTKPTTIEEGEEGEEEKKDSKKEEWGKRFEDFYREYPKKKAKEKACEAWIGKKVYPFAKKEGFDELFNRIMKALRIQIPQDQWQRDKGKFIPYPATWLNQARWEDETMPKETAPTGLH